MSAGGGFRADTDAMAQLTKGINLAMDELKELGFDTEANLGLGFEKLELAGLEVGDNGLHETFADFCDRWSWGVRTLMQDANKFAALLGLSAGMYHEQEEYGKHTFKTVLNQVAGNPYATEEQIKKQSVSEAIKGSTFGKFDDADYSGKSAREAIDKSEEAWGQVGEDFETSPLTGWEDDTQWQWDGPVEESFKPAEGPNAEGGGER